MRNAFLTRWLALALAMCAALGAFAEGQKDGAAGTPPFNPTGLPIVKEKTTLKVFMTQFPEQTVPFNDMTIVKKVEAATGVAVDWVLASSQDYQTRVNLMFASGDLPDVLLQGLTVPQSYVYGQQGLVRPLNDLIEKYGVATKDYLATYPGLKDFVTSPDGKIYILFGFSDSSHDDFGNMVYVNRDWLKAAGLAMPTTTEEFYQALKAFKAGDMNGNGKADEIPFSLVSYIKNFNWSDLNFFGSFGLQMDRGVDFYAVEKGKVVWEPALGGFRDTIRYLNRLYAEGLLDQEAYIQDRSQLQAKGAAKPPVLGAYVSWFAFNVGGTNAGLYDTMGPLKGPGGFQYSCWRPRAMMQAAAVITGKAKAPEVALRWLDYLYTPEINFQLGYGAEGEGTRRGEDGIWRLIAPPAGITPELLRMTTSPQHIFKSSADRIKREMPAHFVLKDQLRKDAFLPRAPRDRALPVFYFNKEDQAVVDSLFPDMKTYMDQKWAEWVMKGLTDKEWDAYLKQIDAMGLPKVLAIYQKGYDALLALKK